MSLRDVCALDELGDKPLAVEIDGHSLALVRAGEEVFAIADECSHASIMLSEGEVDGEDCTIECWRHHARFDLRTGAALDLPATEPVDVYPTTVEDGRLLVDLDNPIKTNNQDSAAAAAADTNMEN